MFRYFKCLCERCKDPTELGSHLSSLMCPKCPEILTQSDPLEDDSPWKCPVHNFVYSQQNVDDLVTDLKAHFISTVMIAILDFFVKELFTGKRWCNCGETRRCSKNVFYISASITSFDDDS